MMSILLAMSWRSATTLAPLRIAAQRDSAPPPKLSRGPLRVLQSSRAPAQLSLFARPHGGG